MDFSDLFVFRGVDVAADDAVAFFADGEVLEELFVFIDEADGGFDLGFYFFTEGEVFFSPPCSPFVVPAVDEEEVVVADGAEGGEPLVVGGDAVEAVAVDDEEAFAIGGGVDVFFGEADFSEGEGEEAFEDFIVVAAKVDDLGFLFFRHLEDFADDAAVAGEPFGAAFEGPAIDDVAVKDEFFATDAF